MPLPCIAYGTLAAIWSAIDADGGAQYRGILRETMPQAEDAYRGKDEGQRAHLGASVLGNSCDRFLWYSFHWAMQEELPPRLVLLLNRGHIEEARIVALLRTIGCEVWQHSVDGNQFRVSDHAGHAGGSLDGVLRGIPEAPLLPILGEFKTHNLRWFTILAGKLQEWEAHLKDPTRNPFTGKGVRATKEEHYAQMQAYMGAMRIEAALYIAVCKDNDAIYAELVPFDELTYNRNRERGMYAIASDSLAPRISNSPAWHDCKFCKARRVCHERQLPLKNCRTCESGSPGLSGLWLCSGSFAVDKAMQAKGCSAYRLHRAFR